MSRRWQEINRSTDAADDKRSRDQQINRLSSMLSKINIKFIDVKVVIDKLRN